MGSDNINKVPAEKHEAPSKSASAENINKDAWGKGADTKIAANPAQEKQEHGFMNIDFKGMGDAFNQGVHNAQEMIANFNKQQAEAQQKAQQEKAAEEARKHAPETAADAAKHGGLVWTTNAEGQQEPQPPGETNPLFGGKVDGPMELQAWARYNQAISSKGFFHASKDDTLDGKRVE